MRQSHAIIAKKVLLLTIRWQEKFIAIFAENK